MGVVYNTLLYTGRFSHNALPVENAYAKQYYCNFAI
jgi:hypothetical protein